MKAIIEGKRYDTSKATWVASYTSPVSRSDFSWREEALYVTAKGAWFLAGCGGPMSQYAEVLPDGARTDGERIIPLPKGEAKAWLEGYGFCDEIEKYFEVEDA